jgi:hypothetical protein
MPDVLRKHQWDCPESCELNLWAAEFLGRQSAFFEKVPSIGKSFADLFRSVAGRERSGGRERLGKREKPGGGLRVGVTERRRVGG